MMHSTYLVLGAEHFYPDPIFFLLDKESYILGGETMYRGIFLVLFILLAGCSQTTMSTKTPTSSSQSLTSESAISEANTNETDQTSETTLHSTTESINQTSQTETAETSEVWRAKVGSLIPAVESNAIEEVRQILLDPTYPINEINEKQESPLLVATHQNNVEIAKLLIDAGADVNQQDEIQDSPYLYAGAEGRTEILAYILEHANPDQSVRNRFGGNALIPAAEKGHIENVKLLLADGRVNIDLQNNPGYTALIEAVALRDGSQVYQDIVKLLIDAGADKTLKDNTGRTASDYAKELGYGNIYRMLQE
jgi:ankyrin repeat protein